ncbi:hypothetical protein BGZ46_004811 [Entomortierella lignicola]|nr:hypothetical protein BGZ46_004811 [Entomortierella lignicola]
MLNTRRSFQVLLTLSVVLAYLATVFYTVTAAPLPIINSRDLISTTTPQGLIIPNSYPQNVNIRDMSNFAKRAADRELAEAQYIPGGTGSGGQYSKDQP